MSGPYATLQTFTGSSYLLLMSKTTVKKAIADFDAAQLRELLLDVYGKSKEAKELLDFFANPDVTAKLEEYKKPLSKEIHRYARRAHRPRIPKIRAILKKFTVIEPGDEAIAELMVYAPSTRRN